MTTDTAIYNTTLDFKIDWEKNRVWSQTNYTSPIWGNYEAFQIALFPKNKNGTLKITDECRWTYIKDIYLNLIFSSWDYYTKYKGIDDEGLHVFSLIDYIQKKKTGNITFHFQDKGEGNPAELVKIGLPENKLGISLALIVIEPPTKTNFVDEGKY